MQFDTMISSDTGRTRETASTLAEFTGHAVKTARRIRERNYGFLEGLTISESRARHSDILERLNQSDPDYIVPKGESHRQHYHGIFHI